MTTTAQLSVPTNRRTQFISITRRIADIIDTNGWHDGVLTVFVPHTTAGVTINENADPDVGRDMEWFSDELIPRSRHFHHGEGNSDAHIKASFYGSSVQVIVRDGKSGWAPGKGSISASSTAPVNARCLLPFPADGVCRHIIFLLQVHS